MTPAAWLSVPVALAILAALYFLAHWLPARLRDRRETREILGDPAMLVALSKSFAEADAGELIPLDDVDGGQG